MQRLDECFLQKVGAQVVGDRYSVRDKVFGRLLKNGPPALNFYQLRIEDLMASTFKLP